MSRLNIVSHSQKNKKLAQSIHKVVKLRQDLCTLFYLFMLLKSWRRVLALVNNRNFDLTNIVLKYLGIKIIIAIKWNDNLHSSWLNIVNLKNCNLLGVHDGGT